VIRSRPDVAVKNSCLLFLLPERFSTNGKRNAILSNFIGNDQHKQPEIVIKKINNWEVITARYY
jgi:hypothetical protein